MKTLTLNNKKLISILIGICVAICSYLFCYFWVIENLLILESIGKMFLYNIDIYIIIPTISVMFGFWGWAFALLLIAPEFFIGTPKERELKGKLEIINLFENALKRYELELEQNPNSTFFTGMVKNTKEYIIELKTKLNQ